MIAFHDPHPPFHDYLNLMYFRPLLEYGQDQGIPCKIITELAQAKNDIVCVDTEYLTPEAIAVLKNNGNKIIGFNIVDSSHLAQCIRSNPLPIDLIFSFTGLQTTNTGKEFVVDKEFSVTLEDRQFMEWEDWTKFDFMRKNGRLLSLPYVHWERQPVFEKRPYSNRSPKVLVRGGAHMRRVILALFLLKYDLLDEVSGFPLKDYFKPEMAEQFRFCEPCRREFHRHSGKYPHHTPICRLADCNSPAKWGNEIDLENMGNWNNRCPESFYWLAGKFTQFHGSLRDDRIDRLMNSDWMDQEAHLSTLGRTLFTSDCKWLHSVYAAQRFWDGALTGCINLLPERTNDQEYFPEMKPGVHYLTYREDFSLLESEAVISKDQYEDIASHATELYNQWMRPTEYAISTNLLRYIFDRIL